MLMLGTIVLLVLNLFFMLPTIDKGAWQELIPAVTVAGAGIRVT